MASCAPSIPSSPGAGIGAASRYCEPARQIVRLRQSTRMDHLAVDDDARRRSDAVARDRGVVGDLLDLDRDAKLVGFRLDHLGRGDAAFATRAEHLDVLHRYSP